MSFLLVSHRHGLLPLAHRLRSQGADVEVLVWKKRFEKAWGGRVSSILRGSEHEIHRDSLQGLSDRVREEGRLVLSDVPPSSPVKEIFEGRGLFREEGEPFYPGSDIRLGGWFDGERLQGLHLLVYDLGAWPGGLGAQVPGGLTLVRPQPSFRGREELEEMLKPVEAALKPLSFRGLVNVGLARSEETGGLTLKGLEAGFPPLHWDAFLSSLGNTQALLEGGEPPRLEAKYTVVLPVSVPPWPSPGTSGREVKIEGVPPQIQGWFFWYDVQMRENPPELWTAGLDGLVGVARGEGENFETARLHAVGLAGQLWVPERQFRGDAGGRVALTLAQLENLGVVL